MSFNTSFKCAFCKVDAPRTRKGLISLSLLKFPRKKPRKVEIEGPKCLIHPDMIVHFWCNTCNMKLCTTCFEACHEDHSLALYKKYLHNQVKKDMGPILKRRKEVHQMAEKVMEKCALKVWLAERTIQRYTYLKYTLNESLKAVGKIDELEAVKRFADDIASEVDVNVVESFLGDERAIRAIHNLAEKIDTVILKKETQEFKIPFSCIVVGRNVSEWRGSFDMRHDDDLFKVSLSTTVAKSETHKEEPLVLSLSWRYLGDKEDRLKAVYNFCGEILIQSFDSRVEHKVYQYSALTLFSDHLTVEQILPVFSNPDSNDDIFVQKTVEIESHSNDDIVVAYSFIVLCSFRLEQIRLQQQESVV